MKRKNPSGKIAYVVKYDSSPRSGRSVLSFVKKDKTLPTIRSIGYPHEVARNRMEHYLGEIVSQAVKDTVKVTEKSKGRNVSWEIEVL